MKRSITKNLAKRKKKISQRTKRKNWDAQSQPMLKASNIHYEVSGRQKGISYGGIGIIHMLAQKTGLINQIDANLELLKRHLPYHESDHVSNLAYNVLAGGSCLQDIELRRNDDGWLDALGAEIIPDPTTAGDFLRRFQEEDVIDLMEVKNTIRQKIWQQQPKAFLQKAVINVDGTICETYGECKQGMDISYQGQWGYGPLVISLDNSREALYLVNRPANAPSHFGSAKWIDKSLDLVCGTFTDVWLRGDTDFSLTGHFDKWDERCRFVFGIDAMPNLVAMANAIAEDNWQGLERKPKYQVKTRQRKRPENVKDQIVKAREFEKIQTVSEQVAEFDYRPGKCQKTYRVIVLRKQIEVEKGNLLLFDDIRYFFYITNDRSKSAQELVYFANSRCDHENDIEQLKNGVGALQAPSDSLISNWAYMVIASLAWDLKAWYGLLSSNKQLGQQIIRMEFKRFINTFIMIPCLIIKTSRRIYYRMVGYNDHLKQALKTFHKIKGLCFT